MHLSRTLALTLVLLPACGDEKDGTGGSTGSDTNNGTAVGEGTEGAATDGPQTSSAASVTVTDPSAGPTTDPSAGATVTSANPTTDPTATDPSASEPGGTDPSDTDPSDTASSATDPGGTDPGGTDASTTGASDDPWEAARQRCVDEINMYRGTLGLPPYQRWTEAELCADGEALADGQMNKPHGTFGMCGESAQNECPGYGGPVIDALVGCLGQMWAEGPGEDFQKHGHYINMSSEQYTKVSCGFADLGGSLWMVQDFQ